jgi:hypothetical protein
MVHLIIFRTHKSGNGSPYYFRISSQYRLQGLIWIICRVMVMFASILMQLMNKFTIFQEVKLFKEMCWHCTHNSVALEALRWDKSKERSTARLIYNKKSLKWSNIQRASHQDIVKESLRLNPVLVSHRYLQLHSARALAAIHGQFSSHELHYDANCLRPEQSGLSTQWHVSLAFWAYWYQEIPWT